MDGNEFIVESCRDKSVSCSYKIMWNPVEIMDVTNLIILKKSSSSRTPDTYFVLLRKRTIFVCTNQ